MGLLPWLILLIGIPVSILLFGVIRDAVESVARLRFERQAGDAKGIIEGRVHSYAQILYALRALFASQPTVTRAEFRGFVEGLDLRGRYPGFDSVNFARYVTQEDAKRFEEEVRRDTSLEPGGYPQFAIKPPGPRAEYFVVVYIEPMRGYEFAFGHDLAASPGVSEAGQAALALHEARDSGKLAASGMPIRIRNAEGEYTALAMRLAVYQARMPLGSIAERRAAYVGSVGAGFNVQKLMKGALDDQTVRYIRFTLYDVGRAGNAESAQAEGRRRFLFNSRQLLDSPAAQVVDNAAADFTSILPVEVGGRLWEIHFAARKDRIIDSVDALLPWVVLIGGVLSSILLSGLFYSLASSRSRALAMANDMTRHLRESEASLAEAQRMAHLGNWSLDPESRYMTWSSETSRLFGIEAETRRHVPFSDFLARTHHEDRALVQQALMGAIEGRRHEDVEHRIALPDGSVRWVHTIVQGDADAPVPGTIMDITERKLAEQELLESRALLNDAQKLAHVGCCQYSPLDGRIIWSDELYRIHGVDPQTFVPSYASAMKLVHPIDRPGWADVLASALRTGHPFSAEFRISRPDGAVRHLRSLGEVIKDASGRPLRMLWSVLDITDHKHTEEALRGSAEQLKALSRRLVEIQEAERRQLSRELHDRVGQNLTALSINLDMLSTGLAEEAFAEHRARLNDSSVLLESTVDSIENVMAELRPPMLDDYGLLPALHWYAKDFSRRTGVEVAVSGSEHAERLAPEIEITLFRIAQEALTNVARHARAKRTDIVLEHSGAQFLMTITDDGIGIGDTGARDSERRPRLGLVTMRERAQAVGATFLVRTTLAGGTQIAISIP
jgi:PAS domain S-box-containing protein